MRHRRCTTPRGRNPYSDSGYAAGSQPAVRLNVGRLRYGGAVYEDRTDSVEPAANFRRLWSRPPTVGILAVVPSPPTALHARTASRSQAARAPRGALLIVFLVVFIDLLGFGIVLPLLAAVRRANSRLRWGFDSQLQGWVIGALLSVFSLMQFVFAPIWGRISDRVGRRPVLLLGLAGSVVFYALFGFAVAMRCRADSPDAGRLDL